MQRISLMRVREALDYEPLSGKFYWKESGNNRIQIGDEAGSISNDGYIVIGLDGNVYQAHILAWLHYYGVWPNGEVDHEDHIRTRNCISNLRDIPKSVNGKNHSKSKANTSGYTGVYGTPSGNWIVRITVNRKTINLGTFSSLQDAINTRQLANVTHNFHPNHGK